MNTRRAARLRTRRPGLRARVTLAFAAGALVISSTVALIGYELTARHLLQERY